MLMTMAASSTSRNTMIAAGIMRAFNSAACDGRVLLHNQLTLSGLWIEFAKERIRTRLERAHVQSDLAAARNHLLPLQVVTLELLGGGVRILHDQLELLPSRRLDGRGLELVVLDREANHQVLLPGRSDCQQGDRSYECNKSGTERSASAVGHIHL